jgi:hexosaminidase
MKYLVSIILLFSLTINAQNAIDKKLSILPYPNDIQFSKGAFSVDNNLAIEYKNAALKEIVSLFENKLMDINLSVNKKSKKKIIIKLIDDKKAASLESYQLKVSNNKIELTSKSKAGVFYGLMSIWQQLQFSPDKSFPSCTINDEPRFQYRGFLLDESRHFFGKEKVEHLLDLMAVFKLNKFHWHLTDEPAWRIEIKQFPKLTTIGAQGNYTNPNAAVKFYSQEEIKEVVAYAKERFIDIIPEIDMPGHATAANKAYPEFSGGGSEKHPEYTFNPGIEATYSHLSKILTEVASLFPYDYIHIGGDEVSFGNEKWSTNDSIQTLMKKNNMSSLVEVEHYFVKRIGDSIKNLNKKLAGWDEIIESNVDKKNSLIYWWRHDQLQQLEKTLQKGYRTILCPRLPLYFDFIQHAQHKNGRQWNGFGSLEAVYNYPDANHNFTKEQEQLIMGLQANLWTERFDTNKKIDYMIFPRLIALSESSWSSKEVKNFARFSNNLIPVYQFLKNQDVYFFSNENPDETPEP